MIKIENMHHNLREIEAKAEILKVIAHPTRLCIVCGLINEPGCNVSKMQSCLGMPQSTISQHLARLKSAGIVKGTRNGLEVNYDVVNEDVIKIVRCIIVDPFLNAAAGKEGET